MAFPFLTAKPAQGRPATDSVSLSMVTDPAHATTASMRLTLYSDSGRTNSVGTDSATASGGSVQERLVCSVGSLSANTVYYPTIEYEEVAGSGTWVEAADVTSDVTCLTQPGASDIFRFAFMTDPHCGLDQINETTVAAAQLRTRFGHCRDAVAAFAPHLVLRGGDETPSTARDYTEQESWDWPCVPRGERGHQRHCGFGVDARQP
jgi:hypothetical protein